MRILVADDHTLFRDSLVSLLEANEIEVVGVAGDGRDAIEKSCSLRPEIALLDLAMPKVDGLEATREIVRRAPDVKVVILTGHESDKSLVEALRAGAQGYLVKTLAADKFLSLLEAAARGEPALPPTLAHRAIRGLSFGDANDPDALTEREAEVLSLMATGITSNRKLARELGVTENTVKFHVRNILDKLHLNSRAQAVGYAWRNHLVEESASEAG